MPPIDPAKIQAKVNELNSGEPVAAHRFWFPADGYHGLTVFNAEPYPTFVPSNGIPLKAFSNRVTGEIRIYDARIFKV